MAPASPLGRYRTYTIATGLTYAKGDSFFGGLSGSNVPITSASRIMDDTVIFGIAPDDDADSTGVNAAAFKGRTIDSFAALAGNVGSATKNTYVNAYHADPQDTGYVITNSPLHAVAIVADNMPAATKLTGKFAYVIKVDVVEKFWSMKLVPSLR
jgi:hypothetical protein